MASERSPSESSPPPRDPGASSLPFEHNPSESAPPQQNPDESSLPFERNPSESSLPTERAPDDSSLPTGPESVSESSDASTSPGRAHAPPESSSARLEQTSASSDDSAPAPPPLDDSGESSEETAVDSPESEASERPFSSSQSPLPARTFPEASPPSGEEPPTSRHDSNSMETSDWPIVEDREDASDEFNFPLSPTDDSDEAISHDLEFPSSEASASDSGTTSTYEDVETEQVASSPRELKLDASDEASSEEDSGHFGGESFVEELSSVADRTMETSGGFEPVASNGEGAVPTSPADHREARTGESAEASEMAERFDELESVATSTPLEPGDETPPSDKGTSPESSPSDLEKEPATHVSPSDREKTTRPRDDTFEPPAPSRDAETSDAPPSVARGVEGGSRSTGSPPSDGNEPAERSRGDSPDPNDPSSSSSRTRERSRAGQFETPAPTSSEPNGEAVDADAPSRYRPRRLGIAGLAVLGIVSIAMGLVWRQSPSRSSPEASSDRAMSGHTVSERRESARIKANTLATQIESTAQHWGKRYRGRRATSEAAVTRARRAVDEGHRLSPVVRRLLEAERFEAARRVAIAGMAASESTDSEFQTLFASAIERDDSLRPETVTLGRDLEIDALHRLGGGRSIGFRLTRGGRSVYSFKPDQKDWGWRAEVATYLLCEVIACHFRIPRNRPARISRATFEALYQPDDEAGSGDYRDRFDRLQWTDVEGPNGETREYLYGTLEDWVPSFVRWPIEYTEVWEPWLDLDTGTDRLDQPLDEALKGFEDRGDRPFYENIFEQRGDTTTHSMARQLSSMLVVDFLVLNWDRFSDQFYGANTQFVEGDFVSIDNGAAFPPRDFHLPEVQRHLARVERFSRSTIASIRALDPDVVNAILFPDPSARQQKRLEVFWRQRQRLLDRVGVLLSQHDPELVYTFE